MLLDIICTSNNLLLGILPLLVLGLVMHAYCYALRHYIAVF